MPDQKPLLIVLGAALLPNGQPSHPMLRRVVTAAQLYHTGKIGRLLLCGGQVKGPRSEAAAMAEALIKMGVPVERLILEEKSRNTLENALYARELLRDHPVTAPLWLVSDGVHLPRAQLLFHRVGLDVHPIAAMPEAPMDWRWRMAVRETCALALAWWRLTDLNDQAIKKLR